MFQGWRFKLREAEEALQHGQLDEVCRILRQSDLPQYLPGKRLSAKVANRLAERARQRAVHGDMASGWRDLEGARSLVGVTDELIAARQEIVAIGLAEAENHLVSNDPARAVALLENMERHEVQDESVRSLKQMARHLESARHLARRGKLAEAEAQLKAANALKPGIEIIARLQREYHEQLDVYRQRAEALHRAMSAGDWSQAVTLADQILEIAPESRLARDARRRAWAKVGARFRDSRRFGETQVCTGSQRPAVKHQTNMEFAPGIAVVDQPAKRRFVLWIDGVGGYLVCLANEVMLGQAVPGSGVDIPVLADVSRRHAKIIRRGDGYVVRPLQKTRVNGQIVTDATLLSDGDEIELARTVRLRFCQPHALSASARLDFISRHRTQPTADGVLLMAESCVLGPSWQNHVVCRDWQGDVVLYQRDDALYCRAMDSIEIDGRLCDGKGPLGLNSRVAGCDFSLSLEELS